MSLPKYPSHEERIQQNVHACMTSPNVHACMISPNLLWNANMLSQLDTKVFSAESF
jgi:hypothetical protein